MIDKLSPDFNHQEDLNNQNADLTPSEHARITQEYATYGSNPRKELVTKRKKEIGRASCRERV